MKGNDKNDRPTAYPKPSETDQQLNNQPEYIDQQPNSLEKDISDVPGQNDDQGNKERRQTAKSAKAQRRSGYRETY